MIFKRLLAQGRLRHHKTSRTEIQQLLRLVDRDIADAQVKDLSSDRRFIIAYEAFSIWQPSRSTVLAIRLMARDITGLRFNACRKLWDLN
jgi:hypothetical protein